MDFDNRLLPFAQRLSNVADDIARKYWRMPFATEQKADLSPVTIADKEIESALRQMIEREYPEHGIVGEEHGNLRSDAAYQWVLDPIDGTRAFIAGLMTFTTLIALVKGGTPLLGIISQPITNERWAGMSKQPSTCNDKPIKTRAAKTLSQATVATTSTYYFTPTQAAAFEKLRKQTANCVLGGDAYSYALLASGQMDLVIDAGMKPYDFCALAPVIQGAGGIVTDWNGKALTLNSDGTILAAATTELHKQALTLLQGA